MAQAARITRRGEAEAGWDGSDTRRSRRHPIPGVLVAIEAAEARKTPRGFWLTDAVDLGAGGMGLVVPPDLEPGFPVHLTFRLDKKTEFTSVPGEICRQELGAGAVRFLDWPASERVKLLEYLVRM